MDPYRLASSDSGALCFQKSVYNFENLMMQQCTIINKVQYGIWKVVNLNK